MSRLSALCKLIVLDVKRTGGNGRIIIVGVGSTDRGKAVGGGLMHCTYRLKCVLMPCRLISDLTPRSVVG